MYNIPKVKKLFPGEEVVQVRKTDDDINIYCLTEKENLKKDFNPFTADMKFIILDGNNIIRVLPNDKFANAKIVFDKGWIKIPV